MAMHRRDSFSGVSARPWALASTPGALDTGAASPEAQTCSVCGKTRPLEALHRKAILGQPQWVCAPSCLEAGRRAMSR